MLNRDGNKGEVLKKFSIFVVAFVVMAGVVSIVKPGHENTTKPTNIVKPGH